MALPLVPLAGVAAKYGAVALAGYVLARRIMPGRTDMRAEDALDDLPDGVTLNLPSGDADGAGVGDSIGREHRFGLTGRWRRTVLPAGQAGGVEIDLAGFLRLRLRRVRP